MSKIGSWILEQEQLTEMYNKFSHNPEASALNEAYDEYRVLRYRNKFGSLNDLVCRYEGEEQYDGSHWTRFLEECTE